MVSSLGAVAGAAGARLASACSRLARLTIPTSCLSRTTGRRLIRCFSINCTTSSRDVSSVMVYGSGVMTSATLRVCVWTYSSARRPGPTRKLSQFGRRRSVASLGAAQEIAFRDDAEKLSVGVDDRQAADFMPQHHLHGLENRRIRPDRKNRPCHDVLDVHRTSPLIVNVSPVESAIQPAQRRAIAEHDPARAWQRDRRAVFENGQRA